MQLQPVGRASRGAATTQVTNPSPFRAVQGMAASVLFLPLLIFKQCTSAAGTMLTWCGLLSLMLLGGAADIAEVRMLLVVSTWVEEVARMGEVRKTTRSRQISGCAGHVGHGPCTLHIPAPKLVGWEVCGGRAGHTDPELSASHPCCRSDANIKGGSCNAVRQG
jgi:hypothetical protein